MQWSFKLGKIFGINFRIHVTFLLLLSFIFIAALPRRGPEQAMLGLLFVCAVFACVLIHELGHSLIARRFGIEAKSITLLPIGGVSSVEDIPEKPAQEIVISLVGPFINLVIAGILYLFMGTWSGIIVRTLYPHSAGELFTMLIGTNVVLAIFNLLPAFPMDGGRALRGILALKMDYVRATSAAVFIGQGFSMFFIFYGLFFNWLLALIGIFLLIGAGGEKQHVMLKSILHKVLAREVMATDFHTLRPHDPISLALEHIYHGCQQDFPVVGDKNIEGILTRMGILSVIHEKGVTVPVSDVMDQHFTSVDPQTTLDEVYQYLLASKKTSMPVLENDHLKGMLSLDGISRYLMVQAALRGEEVKRI
jgi:Zn-dependent protease/predicted transcriptional regulator